MIVEFAVRNFLSFRDLNSLSFVAGNIKEHQENIYTNSRLNHLRILKSVALYGANSSGKSNLMKAFIVLRNMVLTSSNDNQSSDLLNIETFKLDKKKENEPSYFDIKFIANEVTYRYGFVIFNEMINEEWLFFIKGNKQENIFTRQDGNFVINKILRSSEYKSKIKMIIEMTRNNALFISMMSRLNVQFAKEITDWFKNSIIILDSNNQDILDFTAKLLDNKDFNGKINSTIKKSDLGFSFIQAEKIKEISKKYSLSQDFVALLLGDDFSSYRIVTKHSQFEGEKEIGSVYFDLIKNESLGAQKYVSLLGPILYALEKGSLIFIDEIDSKIHNILLDHLLKMFNSGSNFKGAQLIFSTHNTTLLSNSATKKLSLRNSLRRDQMIFFERDKFGATNFMSLYMKKPTVRSDASFEKDYLENKYGGLPSVQLEMFEKEIDDESE